MGILIRLLVQTALMAAGGTGAPPPAGGKPGEEARAKILDAAVAYYAAQGFGRPALDTIAGNAGVSAGDALVLFGDEEKLRQACDEHVLAALVGWAHEKATLEGMSEVMRSYMADPLSYQAQIGYLGKVVAENAPAAARFTGVLVDESESIIRAGIADGTMRPSEDPRALAVLLATTVLGMVTMTPHIERILGVSDSGGASDSQQLMMLRLSVPALELYTHGLYTNDSYLRLVREAVSALRPPQNGAEAPGAASQQGGP